MMTNKPRPVRQLYAYAISAKRYALFNIDDVSAPIIRKASQHGLGHLLAPYPEEEPAPDIPNPTTPLRKLRLRRWQYDFWYIVLYAQLRGNPDIVPFDYHPDLELPAIGRYSATSKVMLGWFKRHNEGRAYEDQVRPFGFLLMLFGRNGIWGGHSNILTAAVPSRGRPTKPDECAPAAPFDRDPRQAAAMAFDRVTGEPVNPVQLRTYAEMIAGYPVSAEDKFLIGGPHDRGTTQRRHIKAKSIQGIGKEANRIEPDGVKLEPAKILSVIPKRSRVSHRKQERL